MTLKQNRAQKCSQAYVVCFVKGLYMQSCPQIPKVLRGQRTRQTSPACQFKEFNRGLRRESSLRQQQDEWIPAPSTPQTKCLYLLSNEDAWMIKRTRCWEVLVPEQVKSISSPQRESYWESCEWPRALCIHFRAHLGDRNGVKRLGSPRCQDSQLVLRWCHLCSTHRSFDFQPCLPK